ncbi:MAG: peptide-methionine (S)-S-oxide reductase MsrA [Chloroflexi bacterium]|nr:peptide-methionine (S)-S-oxide reductase MsrA [Chloroflexota bacterium]
MFLFGKSSTMPTADSALPGRDEPVLPDPSPHAVSGRPIAGPYPDGLEVAEFALGCFWGEEQAFWRVPGVWVTAVGYQGGITPNPTYREVCTGQTGHAEAVRVVFDPSTVAYEQLLKVFWEQHDPTQGMRQGNDSGTQYRSAIFVRDEAQRAVAERSKAMYQEALSKAGYGSITTEIVGPPVPPFFFAEDYHQQYLVKVPNGYCPNHATGVSLPEGFAVTPLQYVE